MIRSAWVICLGNRGGLQDIVCASRNVGINDNHAIAYCLLGYLCAYYRYYHPIEFITAFLNTAANDDDIRNGTILAKQYGIRVAPPKFGISASDYAFDKESATIAKGLSSIKFMGAKVANAIYKLSISNKYEYFSDLLTDLTNIVGLDVRQLSILIHIDFFSAFGNQRELENIVFFWEFFKRGEAKQVKKERIAGSLVEDIVRQYSTDKRKDGTPSASYTIRDARAIIRACEKKVLSLGLSDVGILQKVRSFNEAMGYSGYISGNESDRSLLFIRDVFPVKRKRDGKQFGYNILTQSIGSGIESRFTVFNQVFNASPITKGSVIRCIRYRRDPKGYFTLEAYRRILTDDDPTAQLEQEMR